jgi:Circadian oscillating protein COP23
MMNTMQSSKPNRNIIKGICLSVSTALVLASGNVLAAPHSASPLNLKQTDREDSETRISEPSDLDNVRFTCERVDGEYTVMYRPESQPDQSYTWAKPTLLGGGWTPELRCAEISRRLESYRPDGLVEMRTGIENGYNTVCVTTQDNARCRIVLTVPPGQDPVITRNRVFENLAVADSGQRTDAVNTFSGDGDDILNQIGEALDLPGVGGQRDRSDGIDLRPFLDPADGGTGTRLQGNSSSQLNPDRFR